MGFGSAAGLTSAFGARAGEESGAGSGQGVGRARHGEQRPPPHVATWLPRGPSFQSFLQEEAHTPSVGAKFLDQNLLAAGSKVAEHNSEG